MKQELHVDSKYVHALPMNELYPIPRSNIKVGLIDANHCPGSVLFIFVIELENGRVLRHLHTGDFRATPRMCLHPFIRQPENKGIDCLYLDTTYLNPQYAFPAQEECIKAVCNVVKEELNMIESSSSSSSIIKTVSILDSWIKRKPMINNPVICKPRVLIVVGTYTIGKERVFFSKLLLL